MQTATELEVGLHEMTASEYHADPCPIPSLSSSIAQTLVSRSAWHAWSQHCRLGNNAPVVATAEMDFGDVAHQLLLGKGDGFAVWGGDSWRGKEASAFWDAALLDGKTPIKQSDFTRASSAVAAWRDQLNAFGLGYIFARDGEGESEKVSVWMEGESWCRAMIDRLLIKRGLIVDLKTMSQSAHPKACASRMVSMGYDLRSRHYVRGILAHHPELHGRLKFLHIFAETTAPFAVTPVYMNGEWSTLADAKLFRAYGIWAECMKTRIWPSYTTEPVTLEAPPWMLNAEMGA